MEIGPRALGARSILADPRRPDMKDILNDRVKHREPFRPFAPAVLEEHTSDWFVWDRPSPFMLYVVPIRPDRRDRIPAVNHVDGTARLQTVDADSNPRYRALIQAFYERTGVPLLVNTSFNVMGQPIVCAPEEAIDCFRSTGIDALVLGDFLVGG
jgi:carbamoyltransferase